MIDEISRDALLIYLNDLRIMETIIYESQKKTKQVNNDAEKKKSYIMSNLGKPPKPPVYPTYNNNYKNQVQNHNGGILIIVIGIIFFFFVWNMMSNVLTAMESFLVAICFLVVLSIIGIIFLCLSNKKKREYSNYYSTLLKNYDKSKETYENNHQKYKNDLSNAKKEISELENKRRSVIVDLNSDIVLLKEQLEEAYSANIIPIQFRNIQGIYYLYDYLSTSSQTLSDALMQCNLEVIKEKLDNVIKLQSESIIKQAQANTAIMEQNQRILETAQATMQNTAVAAKYAQISAVNSTLSLELQSKELAYQKADFWLK